MKILKLSVCGIMLGTCLAAFAEETKKPTTPPQAQAQAKPQAQPEVSPLYIYVMGQWAQTTDFAKDAADMIVKKLKLNMENDPKLKPILTDDFQADLKQFIYELFLSRQSLTLMANVYQQYFTIDEMQELLKFYKTPLGQKLVKLEPELTMKTQEVGVTLLKQNEKKYMEMLAKYIGKQKPSS